MEHNPQAIASDAARRAWRDELFSADAWEKDPNRSVSAGEAGGFLVLSANSPFPAYLKPTTICPEGHPRAANEKIVADLADELGVCVPPVLLYRRPGCPATEEPRACLSLVAYTEVHEWKHFMSLSGATAALLRAVLARHSGIIALDAYVGNDDRNNERNAIFGLDPTAPADGDFMFLDHANSLNLHGRWQGNGWTGVTMPPMPAILRIAADARVVEETVGRIAALSDAVIDRIVTRIPEDYMAPSHRECVVGGLKGRRSRVREALRDILRP